MEWRDQGAVLSVRQHGENSAIVEVFTESHGLHAGVVRGGAGRRLAPVLQPGTQLDLSWRARLDEHLGHFTVEPLRSRMVGVLDDRLGLAGLTAICAILSYALPERAAYPTLYRRSIALMDLLSATPAWPLGYLQWELTLLAEMGFRLDLSACAVTGATADLAYVSPRTGRAVSRAGAGEWAAKLLPLVPCMIGDGAADNADIARALATTGYFLERHLPSRYASQSFPAARGRFVDRLARQSEAGLNVI